MSRAPPPRGGIAGLAILLCFTAAAAGVAFDFMSRGPGGFWVGAQPGAAAAIGFGAALFAVIAARLAQFLFGARGKEGSDGNPS
ncbi:hypothetical protein [Terricaulis sp.]|uniref:hypothetical protein n=1 Tax=Terricaulis sp. TaxID=2768686 RepID=UPI002AC42C37|nr:hypothetical protein [Terricaulis sp.]MDZ4690861.1 hypothetical protein [Terricaulis sp.]